MPDDLPSAIMRSTNLGNALLYELRSEEGLELTAKIRLWGENSIPTVGALHSVTWSLCNA